MMTEEDQSMHNRPHLTEAEEALLSAVQTIFEIILGAQLATPSAIERVLLPTRDRYATMGKHDAAQVVEILRSYVMDQKREEIRAQRRKILGDEPQGSA
jgi:hypothetical protein